MDQISTKQHPYYSYLLTQLGPYILAGCFLLLGLLGPQPFLVTGILLLVASVIFVPRGFAFAVLTYHFVLYLPVSADFNALANYTYSIGQVRVYGYDLITGVLALLVLRSLGMSRGGLVGKWAQPLYVATVIQIVLLAVQALFAFGRQIPLDSIIRDAALYLLPLFSLYLISYFSKSDWRVFLRYGYQLTALLPIFQIYQLLMGYTWLTSSGTERTMFIGINVLYIVALSYHLLRERLTSRDMMGIAYFGAAIAVTQYRSAMLAVIVVLAVTLYFYLVRSALVRATKLLVFSALASVVVLFIAVILHVSLLDDLGTRFSTILDTGEKNAQARFGMWDLSWRAFLNNPVLGVGLGRAISDAIPGLEFIANRRWTPHSMIAQTLAVHGFIGMVALIFLHVSSFLRLWYLRAVDKANRHIWETCIAAWIGLLVINLLNSTFTMPRASFVFWGLMAYALSAPSATTTLIERRRPFSRNVLQPLLAYRNSRGARPQM